MKRGRRAVATIAEKVNSIEKAKEEPKGKLRCGGRKLEGVASLSVMMTESADEGDVKRADQTDRPPYHPEKSKTFRIEHNLRNQSCCIK